MSWNRVGRHGMSHDLTPHCVSCLVRVEGSLERTKRRAGESPSREEKQRPAQLLGPNFASRWHMGNMWPSLSWHERIVMLEMLAAKGTEHSQRELAGRQVAVLK